MGGSGGPGNPRPGAGSNCGAMTSCAAATPRGGRGGLACTIDCATINAANGGGGGHAEAGRQGTAGTGTCGAGALGGDASTDDLLYDLASAGGGGGGAGAKLLVNNGNPGTLYGSGGGGGGGVVAIETLGRIKISSTSRINAKGGDGGVPAFTTCNSQARAGEGGGGGGGAIRLRAAAIGAQGDIDDVLDVNGGDAVGGGMAGDGARGRVRLDGTGTGTFDTMRVGNVRGPSYEEPTPIVNDPTLGVSMRASSTTLSGNVYWGVRLLGAPEYQLASAPNADTLITVQVNLAVGLNEICVLASPQASADVASIPEAAKLCTWVARVE
jgi:hypothetical protein